MEDSQIIDAIEQGSFQYAKSLIKIKQSKYPQQSYYQALNAFLLFNQGLVTDCVSASTALLNQAPTDPRTTNLLYRIFNDYGKEKEANQVYEVLVKRFPNNCEANLLQWFENSLKSGNLKSLQKASFNLSKVKSDVKFKYWCALSCYLLAETLKTDPKQYALFKSLGTRVISELNPQSTHELYIRALVSGQDSVEVIEEYSKSKPLDLDIKLVFLDLLKPTPKKLLDYTKKLLFDESFNDFDTWKLYISASKQLEIPILEVTKSIETYSKSRNSKLALVELSKVYESDFDSSILEYYEAYKTKLCCFNDLVHYNNKVIIETISKSNRDLLDKPLTPQNLNNFVNNQKLLLHFGQTDEEYFNLNWTIYTKFLPLVSEKADTDFYMANDLILINCIQELSVKMDHKTIFKQIVILKKLTEHDPLDFRVQLWLLKLYSMVNLNDKMMEIFEILKIRMLQLDSLGYLVMDNISVQAPSKNNLNYLINGYRFYLTSEQDLIENTMKSFHDQIYNKLPNFIQFSKKLPNSFQYFQTFLEIWRMIRILGDKGYGNYFKAKLREVATKCIDCDIVDNRDEDILWKNLGFAKPLLNFSLTPAVKLKMDYLKELYLLESNDQHLKQFNRTLEQNKWSKFDGWLYRIYYNLFKLRTKMNEAESQSIKNYLLKNFKITKVEVPNVLSSEFNYVWMNLIELTKIVDYYVNSLDQVIAKEIIKLNKNLIVELSGHEHKQKQLKLLDNIKSELVEEQWNMDISKDSIKSLFDIYHDSLNKVSYTHIK